MSDQYSMPRRTPLPQSPFEMIERLINNFKEQGETTLSSETIYKNDREFEIIHLVSHIPYSMPRIGINKQVEHTFQGFREFFARFIYDLGRRNDPVTSANIVPNIINSAGKIILMGINVNDSVARRGN